MSEQRPVYLTWSGVGLVVGGGAVGTAGREAVSLAIPALGGLPAATLAVNLIGAIFLGWLLESLLRAGPDTGLRQRIRLLLGTGFAGGFTTYSALATETAELLLADRGWLAVGYAAGTLVLGAAATVLGIVLGARRRRGASA